MGVHFPSLSHPDSRQLRYLQPGNCILCLAHVSRRPYLPKPKLTRLVHTPEFHFPLAPEALLGLLAASHILPYTFPLP